MASQEDYPEVEKTEVRYGIQNIIQSTLGRFSSTKVKVDSCVDPLNIPTAMDTKPIIDAMIELKKKGIRSRLITEITSDNLHSCKEVMKMTTEVHHLDEVKGNFSISDESIYEAAMMEIFWFPIKCRLRCYHQS